MTVGPFPEGRRPHLLISVIDLHSCASTIQPWRL